MCAGKETMIVVLPLLLSLSVGLLAYFAKVGAGRPISLIDWAVAMVKSWQGAVLFGIILALAVLGCCGVLSDIFETEEHPEVQSKKSKAKVQKPETESPEQQASSQTSEPASDANTTGDQQRQPRSSAKSTPEPGFSHDRPRQPYASAPTSASASNSHDRPRPSRGSAASSSQGVPSRKTSTESKAPAAPPKSPRTVARELIGTKLGSAQAVKAAEKVVALQPYMSGQRVATLSDLWGFFDMQAPAGNSFDPQDEPIQTLKSKLNRQRLLFHPDKNEHPDAEPIFKYLEQCHQRLISCFVRRTGRQAEGVYQRTRREEEEFRAEQDRRQKEEAERQAKAEEERRQAEEEMRRAEAERLRLESMRRHKMRQAENLAQRSGPGFWGATCTSHRSLDDEYDIGPAATGQSSPVGSLQIVLLRARDVPQHDLSFLVESNSYAVVRVGKQQLSTSRLPGSKPCWQSSFTFDIQRIDTGVLIEMYRENPGWGLFPDSLIGTIEIPFLDLEEWSGCTIGRVLQAADPSMVPDGEPTLVELRAAFQWF